MCNDVKTFTNRAMILRLRVYSCKFVVPLSGGVTQGSNGLHPPNGTTNGVTNGHVMSASSHAAADADSCKQAEQKRKYVIILDLCFDHVLSSR